MPVLSTFKPTSLPTASPTNHPDHLQYIISLSFFVTLLYILILLIFLFIRRKNIAQQQQRGYAQHAMIKFCNQNRCTFILTTDFDSIIQASLGKSCKFFLGLSRFIYFVCFTFMFSLLNDQEGIKGWAMYYFTNWTILLVAIYFFLSFICSFIAIFLKSMRNPYETSLNLEIEWSCTMRCLGLIVHLLYEVAGASSCFALVFDNIFMNSKNNSMILIFARIVTVTSLILELLMNNIDVRFDQYPTTAAFLMIYFLFIWPEVSFGHLDDWPYEILSASSINCYGYYLIVFILNFIFYCVWYTLYIVKRELYIYYDIGRIAAQDYDYQHVEDEEARVGSIEGGGGGFRLTDAEVQSIGINESVIYIENSRLYDDTTTATTTTTFDYLNTIVFDESNQMYENDFESCSPLHDDSNSWIKAEHLKNISSYNNNDYNNYDSGLNNIAVQILSPVVDVGKKYKVANKAKATFVTANNSPIHIQHQYHQHHSANTANTTSITPTTTTRSVLTGLITLEQVRKRSSSDDNYHDVDEHNGHMVMKASSSTGDYHQSNHYSASNLVNRFNMNRGISTSSSLSTNIKVSSVFDHNNYDKKHHYDNYHEGYHHDNYDVAMKGMQLEHNIIPPNDAIFTNEENIPPNDAIFTYVENIPPNDAIFTNEENIPPNDAIFTNEENINIHEKSFENDIVVNTNYYDKYDNNHNYEINKGNIYQK